jgi:crotonobetainyl-CoA:carnitine CoA-transferase CaiB-like acyl-CoA transferase
MTSTAGDAGPPPGALDDVHVLELGCHIAASYCTKLLADLGAEVYKVEGPDGDPLRAVEPLEPDGDEPTSGLFHYLNANKRGIYADLYDPKAVAVIRDMVERVDIVVENIGPGRLESLGLAPGDLLAANPRLVVVRISSYGQTGPWRDRAASDLTLQAETGMALRLGDPGTPPSSITGDLPQYIGGTFAASAALAALAKASRGEAGSVVDVSLYETLLCSQSPVDVLDDYVRRHGFQRSERHRVFPGTVACRDGDVSVSTLTGQHWHDLCSLIGRPDWIDRLRDVQHNDALQAEFLGVLAEWTRSRDADDVITTMQAVRIAAAVAADGRTMLEQAPFVERQFFVPQPDASFVRPAAPYRLSRTPVTLRTGAPSRPGGDDAPSDVMGLGGPRRGDIRPAEVSRLPLAGVRVVDLTAFLAGGHLTGSMAALGAEVIKVESSRRPDGYRFVWAFPDLGDHWWELSPLWQGQNLAKLSVSIDLSAEDGRNLLARLIATADVVAENFTPRVVESFGFGYERVRELNPRAVMVRMPAFGLEGSWRERAGFAYNIEQVAGLAQNGREGEALVQPAGIVDVVNGQHALVATLAALHYRDRTGAGQLVEVSQVETVACLTADQVIEYQLTGACRKRIGNRARTWAPQGIYASGDERWIAVSVPTDELWQSVCDEVDAPEWARSLTFEERQARHDDIDALLTAWFAGHDAADAVTRLQGRGVPAGTLARLGEVRESPQLAARHYHRRVEHRRFGMQLCARPPVLYSFGDVALGPAPELGQHNDQVLRALGVDRECIDALVRRGIVAEGIAP